MNEMFSQGGKGSTGILTNKQAVARHFLNISYDIQ